MVSLLIWTPGKEVAGAKNDLKRSLDELDDFSYVIEAMIASDSYRSCRYVLEWIAKTKIKSPSCSSP
ncbi:MAG TPA: hypothetical protein VIY08_09590 [Candidatus Nitrosocosmicus sp.]